MSRLNKEISKKIAEVEARKAERRREKARARKRAKSKKLIAAPPKRRKKRNRRPTTYGAAKKLYGTVWYKEWRQKVFDRDGFQCQMCGQIGGRLECHHIRPKYRFPELTLEVSNGICLCRKCHQERVTKYEGQFIFIFERIVKLNAKRKK